LSEALARVRNEVLSRRVDLKRASGTLMRRLSASLFSLSPRAYLGAALCALVVGIAVNALILQRGRHPAPLFGTATAPTPTETITLNSQRTPPPEPAPRAAAEAVPQAAPEAPAAPASAPIPPAAPRHVAPGSKHDAIGDLLHQERSDEDARMLQSARSALGKLGYPVKADAGESSVRDAIRDFEKAKGLPLTNEITPKLVKRLNEAAKSAAR
jgi:hypothetical protein